MSPHLKLVLMVSSGKHITSPLYQIAAAKAITKIRFCGPEFLSHKGACAYRFQIHSLPVPEMSLTDSARSAQPRTFSGACSAEILQPTSPAPYHNCRRPNLVQDQQVVLSLHSFLPQPQTGSDNRGRLPCFCSSVMRNKSRKVRSQGRYGNAGNASEHFHFPEFSVFRKTYHQDFHATACCMDRHS